MTDDDVNHQWVDPNRSVYLGDIGLPGYTAVVVIGDDGEETFVLACIEEVGCGDGDSYRRNIPAHERVGPLPAEYWQRLFSAGSR